MVRPLRNGATYSQNLQSKPFILLPFLIDRTFKIKLFCRVFLMMADISGCNGRFRDSTDDFRLQRPISGCNGRFQVATAEFGFQWPISGCNDRVWIVTADFRLQWPILDFNGRFQVATAADSRIFFSCSNIFATLV